MIGLNGAGRVLAVGPLEHGSNPARRRVICMADRWRGRVEIWRGNTGVVRFQIPLIKPDVRISRIRLSDKLCSFRPRQVSAEVLQTDQPERPVEILIVEACSTLSADFVLSA
jgi:hypothetical protein